MNPKKQQTEELTLNDKIKFDSKGGAILGVLEGPVADFIHDTRNGRHYSEELWENVMKNPLVQEQFRNGGIPGELDHPVDREDICTEKVAVLMSEPPVKKNGQYYGKFNILNTPCGNIVYTLAKAGFKLGVSSRGTGDVDDYTNEVDPSTYEFTCFDVVLLPAVETARMNLVTEGLTPNKPNLKKLLKESIEKSSQEDQKVMKETLDHLGIKLDEGKYMEKKKCVICGKEFEGYGNNAQPVKDGLCCDDCNQKVVIPERLKKAGLNESAEKDDKKKEEIPTDIEDVSVTIEEPEEEQNLEEPTVVDVEKDVESNQCEVDDSKLIEFLHAFLEKQGLELDGEGSEEEDFVNMYHEIVCPECCYQSGENPVDIKDDEEVLDSKPEVDDIESAEILEQLQKVLKENNSLKENLKTLQKEKAVSGAKVSKLNEELANFKSIAASAGKKVLNVNSLETKNAELQKQVSSLEEKVKKQSKQTELYESRINKLIDAKEETSKSLDTSTTEINRLKESLESVKQASNKKLDEAKNTITKSTKLVEKYKEIAHDAANRYIERRALGLGVSKNEIINRLDESYTLDDVDKICEDLEGYSLNMSRLPFTFDKPGNVKMRMRENKSRTPLKELTSQYDDEVDDYLLDLAGLNNK